MMHRVLYTIFVLCGFMLCSTSCSDDELDSSIQVGEGESLIKATVAFKPFSEGLASSRGSDGEAIKKIDDLCVLVYNEGGTALLDSRYFTAGVDGGLTITEVERHYSDADNKELAEAKTDNASFEFPLPYGKYQICAVANMGNIANNATYSDNIKSVEGLKKISLSWNSTVTENDQMFGSFTEERQSTPEDFTTLPVTIDKPAETLHAWIKRVASKVTVAYNGEGLNPHVHIYVKSVTIKDIPKTVLLGADNTPTAKNQLKTDGESIIYSNNANYANWPEITKDKPYFYRGVTTSHNNSTTFGTDAHGEKTEALFFFENLQGTGKDKRQDANEDGNLDKPGIKVEGNDGYKDNEAFGSYIEVKAYYQKYFNNDDALESEGDIIYRFMLGKNETTDYNAERNYHYKLTLKFKGDANDVDWHIEYDEEPGVYVPKPYYISYLYNQSMTLPIRVAGLNDNDKVIVKIIRNDWYPTKPAANGYDDVSVSSSGDYYTGTVNNAKYNGTDVAGFLTLNKSYINKNQIEIKRNGTSNTDMSHTWTTSDAQRTMTVKDINSNGIEFYTRPKTLVGYTGYTGSNPFMSYRRKALVQLYKSNGTTKLGDPIVIWQVERIVNPTGIWRNANSIKPFHVRLMTLDKEQIQPKTIGENYSFSVLDSDGPWTASIESGNWELDFENSGGTGNYGQDKITGEKGKVQFYVRPKSTISANSNNCGILKVTYHDNTCVHLIFLRQGDAPIDVVGNGTYWHSYNMYKKNTETNSPLEEGSLFKYANWDNAILATNNLVKYFNAEYFGNKGNADALYINNASTTKDWDNIAPMSHVADGINAASYFSNPTIDPAVKGRVVEVARASDWEALKGANMAEGFGVLYGDGATETADKTYVAYGYVRNNTVSAFNGTTVSNNNAYGMRGCFYYNVKTGNNVFFPVGASGYGRRVGDWTSFGHNGILRYSTSEDSFKNKWNTNTGEYPTYRPLMNDLYISPGAVYWYKGGTAFLEKNKKWDRTYASSLSAGANVTAWDINYQTYYSDNFADVAWRLRTNNGYDPSMGSDACFVRLVEK